jgi:hypothetical protein
MRAVIMCAVRRDDLHRATEWMLEWLLPSANPAGTVYGTIAIGALLAAESGRRETYLETIVAAILAISLYWLAHAYAELLGLRLESGQRLTGTALRAALRRDWSIMRGAGPALLALLISWLLGLNVEDGVTAALWTVALSLLAFELLAGLRAQAHPAELLVEGSVGAAMGLGVLALRVILH